MPKVAIVEYVLASHSQNKTGTVKAHFSSSHSIFSSTCYFSFPFWAVLSPFSLYRQSYVSCAGCWWCRKKKESFQWSRAGGVGVWSHPVWRRALWSCGKAPATRERAHLGRNSRESQRCVQSPTYSSRGEEALGWLEETQRRPASGCSPPQLLPAIQQRGLDAWASIPDEPQTSASPAKAKHQTKALFSMLPWLWCR